ncbi:MAG: hypothetical protein LQ339_007048 [Xanthoria mediterranea]|nr:MAG: hypothetical protein LQ339_007048 [Xanthoria mediterranea]
MKFIINHTLTKQYLQEWASSRKLITASCFFWISGNPIQKSLHGLLRALLFRLLSQAPHRIQESCPWRWRSYNSGSTEVGSWTDQQLLKSFNIVIKALSTDSSICLFIDGLDEFGGDDLARLDLLKFLEGIRRLPNVKICVSSCPYVAFIDVFGQGASLELHGLRQGDIATYVESELFHAKQFERLKTTKIDQCSRLADQIRYKAEGVFLWVRLVIRELIQCLCNRDGIEDLQRRLDSIPSDLGDFFRSIFDRLDHFHFEKVYKLLKTAAIAADPGTLLTYFFIPEGPKFDPFKMDPRNILIHDIGERLEDIEIQIKSICQGLLEVAGEISTFFERIMHVQLIHRSITDFLNSDALDKMEVRLEEKFAEPFEPCRALALSRLAEFKTIGAAVFAKHGPQKISMHIYDMNFLYDLHTHYDMVSLICTAAKDVNSHHASYTEILDDLHETGCQLFDWNEIDDDSRVHAPNGYQAFLANTLSKGLRDYVIHKISENPSLIRTQSGRPLLDCVLRYHCWDDNEHSYHIILYDFETIEPRLKVSKNAAIDKHRTAQLLLESGADPNQFWNGNTIWAWWLGDVWFELWHEADSQYHPNRIHRIQKEHSIYLYTVTDLTYIKVFKDAVVDACIDTYRYQNAANGTLTEDIPDELAGP